MSSVLAVVQRVHAKHKSNAAGWLLQTVGEPVRSIRDRMYGPHQAGRRMADND
jgi:hypothetical protein